jgi:membrane protein DedA with SNARE-associated domain
MAAACRLTGSESVAARRWKKLSVVQHIWFLLHHYDKLALFGLLAIEESGIPIPVPGDVVMMYAGYQVRLGALIWYQALLCGVLATLVGSCVLYHVGRHGGRPLLQRYGRYLHLSADRQAQIERWLQRYGGLAVFVGRLIPGMRCGSSFVAGTFGVRYPTFVVATAASAVVWWGLFLYLGSQVGRWVAPMFQRHPQTVLIFLGFVVLTSVIPLYVRWRMGQENAARSVPQLVDEVR